MSRKLLYVEDSDLVGRFVVEALKQHDVDVVLVSTAAQALSTLTTDATAFSMVLSDQSLPDQTGLELLASLRPKFPHLRLVLTTGFVDAGIEQGAQSLDGLLPKPFAVGDVLALIAQ
ncbi:MAG: response regulator [Gammaproteobacteria bacterium]